MTRLTGQSTGQVLTDALEQHRRNRFRDRVNTAHSRLRANKKAWAAQPPEGGVKVRSRIKVRDVRSIARERFVSRWGRVDEQTTALVEDRIRPLLGL